MRHLRLLRFAVRSLRNSVAIKRRDFGTRIMASSESPRNQSSQQQAAVLPISESKTHNCSSRPTEDATESALSERLEAVSLKDDHHHSSSSRPAEMGKGKVPTPEQSSPGTENAETAKKNPLVFFDLETTDLPLTCDITQIAAACDEDAMNVYVKPTQPIHPKASEITGLSVIDGRLCHHGEPVDTTDIGDALGQFLKYLKQFDKPILVAHNCRNFDGPILKNHLAAQGLLGDFNACVGGFVDTLEIARQKFPKGKVPNHRQETLVRTLLQRTYDAHNAITDVEALQELYKKKLSVPSSELPRWTFTFDQLYKRW